MAADEDLTRSYVPVTIGTTVGRYKIVDKIGAGGMGEVFLAEDNELHRKVALKFLPYEQINNETLRARFTREAQAIAALSHPNVVTIHEVGEYHRRPFYAMQFVQGENLREYVLRARPATYDLLTLALHIAEGLQSAHTAGIVHRDIKPANIVIESNGRPVLLDFGLATGSDMGELTQQGTAMGTLAYMAPEQLEGKNVDARADLFAFGALLYEMLTGTSAFKKNSDAATVTSVLTETPAPLTRFSHDIPPGLQTIIDKSLEKDLTMRYQSAAEIIADLKRERRQFESGTHSVPSHKIPHPGKRNKAPLFTWIGVAGLLMFVLFYLKPWQANDHSTSSVSASEGNLAVMYFENLTDRQDSLRYGEMVTNLLVTELSAVPGLRVLSTQRLYDILKSLGKEGTRSIDRSTATQIAKSANASRMVTGTIVQLTPRMVMTYELIDVNSGKLLASRRVLGESDEELFVSVERLADTLAPSISSGAATRPLTGAVEFALAGTKNIEAYRAYLAGLESANKYYIDEALTSFHNAIALDSGFPPALLEVVARSGNIAGSTRTRLIELAEANLSKLGPKERLFAQCEIKLYRTTDSTAVFALDEYLGKYPDDKKALSGKASTLRNWGKSAQALPLLYRAISYDSSYGNAYNELAYAYSALDSTERALWAIERYAELAPNEANPHDSKGDMLIAAGRLEEAIPAFETALRIQPTMRFSKQKLVTLYYLKHRFDDGERFVRELWNLPNPNDRAQARNIYAVSALLQGNLAVGEKRVRDAISVCYADEVDGFLLATAYFYLADIEDSRRNQLAALSALDSSVYYDTVSVQEGFNSYFAEYKVNLLAKYGKHAEARQEYEHYRKFLMRDTIRYGTPERTCPQASMLLYQGKAPEAVTVVEKEVAGKNVGIRKIYLYALAAYQSGQNEKAVNRLESLLQMNNSNWMTIPTMYGKSIFLLGQCYEASGWKTKAIAEYERFLDLYKNADPVFNEVKDAKERLAKLRA